MTVNDVIIAADRLRPNQIPWELKAQWVQEIEAQVAEMMGEAERPHLTDNSEMLLPDNHNSCYMWYVACQIDKAAKDNGQFGSDMVYYAEAVKGDMGWWRRNNRPPHSGHWKV